jgi:phage-related protein
MRYMDAKRRKIIDVQFYMSDAGSIPVKEWLKKLITADRKNIGDDIRTVEFGWPIGMPLVGKIDTDLWEVRSNLSNSRISRVLFTVNSDMMVLLHAFIKKTPKTPKNDLKTAKRRMSHIKKEEINDRNS